MGPDSDFKTFYQVTSGLRYEYFWLDRPPFFSLKGKKSLNDSRDGTDEATEPQEKEKGSMAPAHVRGTSPQRSQEAGADGGDVVFRQDWVSV